MSNNLQCEGLKIELLDRLSYKSELGNNLKKNLHYFDKELVTISRPSAYGEYEPDRFVDSKEEFAYAVEQM